MEARDYQQEAIGEVEFEIACGQTNIVVEAPTSFGKSIVISKLAESLDGNRMVMTNLSALIEQLHKHLNNVGVEHSVLKAGYEDKFDVSSSVQLVMSQTFYARQPDVSADYILIDERHKEYDTSRTRKLLNHCKPKAVVGFTATPYDQKGYALSDAFVIRTTTVKELTEQGYLSPIKYYIPKWSTDLDLDKLRMSGVDYSSKSIDEMFNTNEFMNLIVTSMDKMNAKEKKTLVFCNSIEQCEFVNSELRQRGYAVDRIHSKMDAKHNDAVLSNFKGIPRAKETLFEGTQEEKIKCLVSVSMLSTGFDVPDIELGVMLRPTKVRSLFIQTVGRLCRIAEGKEFAEFLDLAGTVMEHGFHDEIYIAPEKGNQKALAEAKAKAEASALKHIVEDSPTEIDRDRVEVFVEELRRKEDDISTMSFNELDGLYQMTSNARKLIEIAYRMNEIKTGATYKESTIDWIHSKWEEMFISYPDYKRQWTNALRTRAKNIVRQGKKLASLYYFIDWLAERVMVLPETPDETESYDEIDIDMSNLDDEIPF